MSVDYSNYINDSSLIGEFVRLVLSKDISDEDKNRIIEVGIKALKGEAI